MLAQVTLITYMPDFNTKEIVRTEGANVSRVKMECDDDGFICGLFPDEGRVSIQYSFALLAPMKRPASMDPSPLKKPASKRPAAAAPLIEKDESEEEEESGEVDAIVDPSDDEGGGASTMIAPLPPTGVLKYGKQDQCMLLHLLCMHACMHACLQAFMHSKQQL